MSALRYVLFFAFLLFCVTPWASPPLALGARPLILGMLLWIVISCVSLLRCCTRSENESEVSAPRDLAIKVLQR